MFSPAELQLVLGGSDAPLSVADWRAHTVYSGEFHVYIYLYVYLHICICIYVCVCMYIYMCVCVYIYISTLRRRLEGAHGLFW